MDNSVANAISEVKYKKLASEYAKLRAQASVLKKAVLEEQAKYGTLREQLRHREATMRRTEQEVDSLGFRNKQLEQRVAALQLELCKSDDAGKRSKSYRRLGTNLGLATATGSSGSAKADYSSSSKYSLSGSAQDLAQDALIFEELQKKIMENAQLTSLVDDKSRDVLLYTERITHLEQNLEKRCAEQSEMEKRLRRELEALQSKNAELETKLVEAVSMLGSEDALSVTGSDFTPLQQSTNFTSACLNTTATETRISSLEKEVLHWRTQYELAKMQEAAAASTSNTAGVAMQNDMSCGCSTTAAGITVTPSQPESKSAQRARDSLQEPSNPPTKEHIIYNNVSQKYEELLKSKCLAESRMVSYETETENLQGCLENATDELKAKDEQIWSLNQAIQMLEEDLSTTRVNYEEQISVLTEQVINLSDQLAACK